MGLKFGRRESEGKSWEKNKKKEEKSVGRGRDSEGRSCFNPWRMKTISGRVTSSNPISLSKATSVLTTFVAAETGASQAVNAYLRRTVEAFNELNQLHRELKGSKSSRKHKRAKENCENHRLHEVANEHEVETESAKESHKKKKHKEREERSSLEFEEERREKKKKRKKAEVDEGGVEHPEEQQSKKKRKKSD